MATVDELLIRIDATTESLRRELKKAEQSVSQAAGKFGRDTAKMDHSLNRFGATVANVTKVLAVFGLALGVSGMVGLGRRAIEAAGGIGQFAQQLGLSTDALQVYQYAATQARVTTEELKTGFTTLTRTIGLAVAGEKTAVDAFRALGVELRNADGTLRSTEQVFAALADRIQSIPSAAQQTVAAQKLMGEAGSRLLPILAQGSEGLARYEEAARRLGLVLDEATIQKADAASSKLAEMTLVMERNVQRAFIESAPAILRIADLLGQAIPVAAGYLARALEVVANNIELILIAFGALAAVKAVQMLAGIAAAALAMGKAMLVADAAVKKTVVGLVAAAAAWLAVETGVIDLSSSMAEFDAIAATVGVDLQNLVAGGTGAKEAFAELTKATKQANDALDRQRLLLRATGQGQAAVRQLQTALKALDAINKALEGSQVSVADFWGTTDLKEQVRLVQRFAGGVIVSIDAIDEQALALARAVIETEKLVQETEAVAAAQTAVEEATKKAAEDAKKAAEQYQQEVRRVSESIAGDLTTALFEGAENGFDNIFENIGLWMRRIGLEILKQKIVLPITMQIVDAMPALFGVTGGASGVGGNGIDLFGAVGSFASDAWNWAGRTLGFAGSAAPTAGGGGLMGSVLQGGMSTMAGAGSPSYWAQVGGLGGVLGGAGTGLAIGGLLGSLTGGNSVGSSIGGTVGGIAGSFLTPVLGPVAPILGGALGGILGGLFGNKRPSDRGQWATANLATGQVGRTGLEGDKFSSANRQIADTLADRLVAFVQSVEQMTGAQFSGNYGFIIGDRDGQRARIGNKITKVSDSKNEAGLEKLFDYVAKAAVGAATGLDSDLEKILKRSLDLRKTLDDTVLDLMLAMEMLDGSLGEQKEEVVAAQQALDDLNKTFDDAATRAKELRLSEEQVEAARQRAIAQLKAGFVEGIEDQILAITDPMAFALKQLDQEFETIRANAEVFGVGMVEVERLYALRRMQVIEQIGQASVSSLQKFLEQMRFGELSGASPENRLSGARAAFEAAAAQALAGDITARGRIEDLGRTLLDSSRDYNASGAGYFADLARVEEIVQAMLAGMPGFARGTLSAPGGPAIVGERGPELMFVPRGASILPNGFLNLLSGQGIGGNDNRDLLKTLLQSLEVQRSMNDRLGRLEQASTSQDAALRRIQTLVKDAA